VFTQAFADRQQAGRVLAEQVAALGLVDPVVLALPRGGVTVAAGVWDGTMVASRLSAQAGGVMQCVDGRLVYADDALLTRLTTDGRFQCTEWKITDGPDRR